MSPRDEHASEPALADLAYASELIPIPVEPAADLGVAIAPAPRTAIGHAPRADIWRAYLDQVAVGYVVYLVGAVTAFLAVVLALTDGQAGLHSSALAAGMVAAGLVGERIDRLFGIRLVHVAALGLLGLAGALLAWAPAFAVTLLGAAAVGTGCGLILGHVNQTLTAGGGTLARVQLSRSTLLAMLSSVTVPLVIGLGVATGLGWQFAVVPSIVLVGIAVAATVGRADRPIDHPTIQGRLPLAYWLRWLLVVLVVAVEFAVVFWGSSLVERRTGVSLADATLTISAYIGGMIVGRLALSTHEVSGREPIWLMRGGIALALVGTLLAWASGGYEASLLAMLIGGLGTGMLFPLGASITLAAAPGQAAIAAPRLVLASGVAILVAPLVLGVVADATGIMTAWLLIPAICAAALLLTLTLPAARTGGEGRT